MNPTLLVVLAVLAGIAAAIAGIASSWTRTPHGRLDIRVAILLKLTSLLGTAGPGATPEELRASRLKSMALLAGRPQKMENVTNLAIPGPAAPIPVRIYSPARDPAPLPVVVFYHGGGFVIGDLDTHDALCRSLALRAHVLVVSVDYRRAPEHRFPAAVDDAWAALLWAADNAPSFRGDPSRIAVAGDSAGGNLSAVVSLLARDRGGPAIRAQVMVYPGVDFTNMDTPSYRQFERGYLLTKEAMVWFTALYVPDRDARANPLASPLLAPDHGRLPPALIITAQFDPLRDEGEAYAHRLEDAGVPVQLRRFDGMVHGFVSVDRWLPQAREAITLVAAALRERFEAAGNAS